MGFSPITPLKLDPHTVHLPITQIYIDPSLCTLALLKEIQQGSCVCSQKCSAIIGLHDPFGNT